MKFAFIYSAFIICKIYWSELCKITLQWLLLHRTDITDRNVIITANDMAEPPSVTPPSAPLHPNPLWPTASGVNETEARRICQAPILQSPVFPLCQKFTEQSLKFIIDSCMTDLQVKYSVSEYATLHYAHFTVCMASLLCKLIVIKLKVDWTVPVVPIDFVNFEKLILV